MIECLRCGVQNELSKWAENGFVCPFCDRWYNEQAQQQALAERGGGIVATHREVIN